MSFTSNVKNEVSRLETVKFENISELSAILRNSEILDDRINVITENASVARRVYNLIKGIYGITCRITVRKGYNY
ncbi:MAG TPA: sporulation regulator WhiA, partial [Tenericutes bacterium]|nr:sporulation regulator WhiA [Mycoplasmatota bacterium]